MDAISDRDADFSRRLKANVEKVKSGEADGILIRCFSRQEADRMKDYTDSKFPDTPIYFSWLEFYTPEEMK